MLNIADFGGFSGIAKLIKQVKDTGEKLMLLSTSTGVTEVAEIKTKYIDALDAFRPGNTQGVAVVANDFVQDADRAYKALQTKIKDPDQLKQAQKTYNECRDSITAMLGIVMNALRKAG